MQGTFGEIFNGKSTTGFDVQTPMGRITFIDNGSLFAPKPRGKNTGKEQYSGAILLAKHLPVVQAWKAQLESKIQQIAATRQVNPDPKYVIEDGDTADLTKYPEMRGMWIVSANSDNQPRVVDENAREIHQPTPMVYSGMLGILAGTVSTYVPNGGGVTIYLGGVQRVGDAEPFGNGAQQGPTFGAVDQGAAQQMMQQYSQQAPVQQTYTPPPQYPQQAPVQQAYTPPPPVQQAYTPPPPVQQQQYPQQVGPQGYAPPPPPPQQQQVPFTAPGMDAIQ